MSSLSATASWNLLSSFRADGIVGDISTVVAPTALLVALRLAEERFRTRGTGTSGGGEPDGRGIPPHPRWLRLRDNPDPPTARDLQAMWTQLQDSLSIAGIEWPAAPEVRLPSRELFHVLIWWVEQFDLGTAEGRRQAGEALTELVQQTVELSRFGGEFVTPPALGQLMVALAAPQPGERIYDPCFGTGGLLLDAVDVVRRQAPGETLTELYEPQFATVFGVERSKELHLVAFVRLLLTGVFPRLVLGNALEHDTASRHEGEGFDCILADPPWGAKLEGDHLVRSPFASRSSESLFLQHAVRALRPGGRAVVAVPPALLERTGVEADVRHWLLSNFRVDAVVRFGLGAFRSLRMAPPALLVLCRAPPARTVPFWNVTTLPKGTAACRALSQDILADEDGTGHTRRHVAVEELLKAGAQLAVPAALEVVADEELATLAQKVPLRALGEVTHLTLGTSVERKAVTTEPTAGALPLVRVGDVAEGLLRLGGRFLPADAQGGVRRDQHVQRGDVLLSVDGTIGKVAYVQDALGRGPHAAPAREDGTLAAAQKGLVILRPRDGSLEPRFLAATLASSTYQAALRRLARGVTIAHLPLSVLRKLSVPVPSIEVQERVVRRLLDQPGDALEALVAVLAGKDEGPLARFFRESAAAIGLTGEGVPEEQELQQLALDVIVQLRALRNMAAHADVEVGAAAMRWLAMVGALPLGPTRREPSSLTFHILDAVWALLERALESAQEMGGILGRQTVRLTERLLLWADRARARAAGDFRLQAETHVEQVRGRGSCRVRVHIKLLGTATLQAFNARLDVAGKPLIVEALSPEKAADLFVDLDETLPWKNSSGALTLPVRLDWTGQRVDGERAAGELPLLLHLPLTEHSPSHETPMDLGVSPYITGDVVERPEMFFGRHAVLDTIRTHLGGGTKVILLEGNRRTGKTSILRQLQRQEVGIVMNWVPVECSFQGTVGDASKDGIPTQGVFRLLVRDIGLACSRAGIAVPLPDMPPVSDPNMFAFRFVRALTPYFTGIDPYEALQFYVDRVTAAIAPRRLLLMLDEFDKLQVGIDNGVTSPQVPENIRNLLQTRPALSTILTGSRRLKRLREEYWSALFGFGHRIGVDPLEPAEVSELARRPVAGRLEYDNGAVDLIAEFTACQPYLVQSLCARVFELAKRNGWRWVDRDRVLEAADRMVHDNEHFQALWSYAETERRRYLLCLCHRLAGGPQRMNAALLNQHLEDAGVRVPVELVDEDLKFLLELELVALENTELGPQYALSIPLMRRWMDKNIDAEAQRRKTVHEAVGGIE